jgi:hypothetical protein
MDNDDRTETAFTTEHDDRIANSPKLADLEYTTHRSTVTIHSYEGRGRRTGAKDGREGRGRRTGPKDGREGRRRRMGAKDGREGRREGPLDKCRYVPISDKLLKACFPHPFLSNDTHE